MCLASQEHFSIQHDFSYYIKMFHLFSKILKGINIIGLWPSVRPCVHPCIGHTFRFQKFLIILKCNISLKRF